MEQYIWILDNEGVEGDEQMLLTKYMIHKMGTDRHHATSSTSGGNLVQLPLFHFDKENKTDGADA